MAISVTMAVSVTIATCRILAKFCGVYNLIYVGTKVSESTGLESRKGMNGFGYVTILDCTVLIIIYV